MKKTRNSLASTTKAGKQESGANYLTSLSVNHCVEQITQPLNVGSEVQSSQYGKGKAERLKMGWEENQCVYVAKLQTKLND